jgi:hypothetical protein
MKKRVETSSTLKIEIAEEKLNNKNNYQETNKKTIQQHLATTSKKLNLYLLVNYK